MTTTKTAAAKMMEKKLQKEAEKKQSAILLDNAVFEECLNVVASTKEGQYILNRLMDNCGQLRSSVTPSTDGVKEEVVNYKEGRRSIWLYELHRYLSVKNLKIILFLDRSKLCQVKKTVKVVVKKTK